MSSTAQNPAADRTSVRVSRIPELDGVRGLAIVLLVVSHAGFAHHGGIVGVTLFFVLSGFLITRILVHGMGSGGVQLARFYARRARRLLPALLVFLSGLSVLIGVMWGLRGLKEFLPDIVPALLYFANVVYTNGGELFVLEHTWSLSVEEHFYLLWPILISVVKPRAIWPIVALALAWRLRLTAVSDFDRVYYGSDTNAFALLVGCGLAMKPPRQLPRWSVVVGIIGLLGISVISDWGDVALLWLQPVAVLASAIAVWGATSVPMLANDTLRFVGRISYGLYLWHGPLLWLPILWSVPFRPVWIIGLAVAISYASWRLVEQPILAMNPPPEPSGSTVTAAAM